MKTSIPKLRIEVPLLHKAALIFRAVNNKVRLQILNLLVANKRMMVSSLYENLRLEQSATSQHLAILRKAGFVNTEREGRCIYYSINYERLKELHTYATQLLKV